jgi:hypothetical protein
MIFGSAPNILRGGLGFHVLGANDVELDLGTPSVGKVSLTRYFYLQSDN